MWWPVEFGGGGRFERTFIDVRVFNPYASSNRTSSSLSACYRHHEQEKRRRYDRRVREVERSTFLPFVLSSTRGCGKGAAALVSRIAHLQSLRGRGAYCPPPLQAVFRPAAFECHVSAWGSPSLAASDGWLCLPGCRGG